MLEVAFVHQARLRVSATTHPVRQALLVPFATVNILGLWLAFFDLLFRLPRPLVNPLASRPFRLRGLLHRSRRHAFIRGPVGSLLVIRLRAALRALFNRALFIFLFFSRHAGRAPRDTPHD